MEEWNRREGEIDNRWRGREKVEGGSREGKERDRRVREGDRRKRKR